MMRRDEKLDKRWNYPKFDIFVFIELLFHLQVVFDSTCDMVSSLAGLYLK